MRGLRQTARVFEKHEQFFISMKINSPQKWDYIINLDEDLEQAYRKYMKEVIGTKIRLQNLYYKLEEKKLIAEAGRQAVRLKLMKNKDSIYGYAQTLFNHNAMFVSHPAYLKALKIEELWKKILDD